MDLIQREIRITFDPIDSVYTIEYSTSRDGVIFEKKYKSMEEVCNFLSKTTKTKIVWGVHK